MIYVVLRSGRVLQYSNATGYKSDSDCINILQGKNGEYGVAKFPLDVVERVEFVKPSKQYRQVAISKVTKQYKV